MIETMKLKDGVGLAAPQIGVTKRMFVIRKVIDGKVVFNCKMVNPIIIPKGTKTYKVPGGEGCLSVPDKFGIFERAEKVWCTYTDENGNRKVVKVIDNGCLRGPQYVEKELLNPTRTLTTTIAIIHQAK